MSGIEYNTANKLVTPVEDLLKACAAVNWSLTEAGNRGWAVELDVCADTGCLMVKVAREGCWPEPDDEPAK